MSGQLSYNRARASNGRRDIARRYASDPLARRELSGRS